MISNYLDLSITYSSELTLVLPFDGFIPELTHICDQTVDWLETGQSAVKSDI